MKRPLRHVNVSTSFFDLDRSIAPARHPLDSKNRVFVAESVPNDGEAPVIVGLADAAMHMYTAAIDSLPEPADPEYPDQVGVVLAGLRKLQGSLAEAAARNRVTPAVIVALSGVRTRYDELMAVAANGSGATMGQRLYVARLQAKLSAREAANGVGLRADVIEAVEAEEPATEGEAVKIKDLIAALGG